MKRSTLRLAAVLALALSTVPAVVEAQEASSGTDVGTRLDEVVTSPGTLSVPDQSSAEVAASGQAFDPGPLSEEIVNEPAPVVPPGTRDPLDLDPEPGQESVIGPDDRTQVTDTTSYPNSAIGQLVFDQGGSTYMCTGALIDQNTVLTAGHCVGNSTAGWSTNVSFTPARNGNIAPFGSCAANGLGTVDAWHWSGDEYHDWGWVQLDCTIGQTVGWFGYAAFTDAEVANRPTTVRGYPGDKDAGTMWTDDDVITVAEADMLYYQNDTYGGMSGSPVYGTDSRCNGRCIMAVHAYGTHGAPPHSTNNHGPRITDSRASMISHAAESTGRPHSIYLVGNYRPDNWIRRGLSGRWVGNNVYNHTGTRQTRMANVPRLGRAHFYVRVQNDGDYADDFWVKGSRHNRRFGVRYYRNRRDITPAVKSGTHRITNLQPGRYATIRVQVTAKRPAQRGHQKTVLVTSTSDFPFTTYRDTAKAVVTRR